MKTSSLSIVEALNANYGIAASNLTLLPAGADRYASLYKAEVQGGPTYFIKVKRGRYSDVALEFLLFLKASGMQQIITPIRANDGKLSHTIDNWTIVVYPFVEGQNGFDSHLTDNQWVTLGHALKQVHAVDLPPAIKNRIGEESYSTLWYDSVFMLLTSLNEDSPDEDEISSQFRQFIKNHRALIYHLLDRSYLLGQLVRKQSPEFVLCHSDIHAGNVLIDRSGAIYIVDWDDPIMAPKERDLMFIGGGVGNIWNRRQEEELFYQGYGKTTLNKAVLAYYRHRRIIEDMDDYKVVLGEQNFQGKNRRKVYQQFTDMFKPNGVIDIALKSDIEARLVSSEQEKNIALDFRQKQFFDHLKIEDPYRWTLEKQDHLHWLLYEGDQVVGYAHVQLWSDCRAALRIIVIDEHKRRSGLGRVLMDWCEILLEKRGITLLQIEASPTALPFYKALGYIEMPFNNPDGEPTHPNDQAVGKYLRTPNSL